METVTGAIIRVTYYDEKKGFGIVKIKLDYKDPAMAKYKTVLFSNQLTVLSSFDRKPLMDEEFEFQGEFEVSSYGMQLKAKTFVRRNEQSKEGVVTYLSSDYFPGVGQVSATKIFEALGPTCIKDIINDKNVLDSIDITEKQKTTIYEGLVANAHNEQQLIGLLNLGITMKVAIRIIRALPLNAYELVKSNPYQLIDSVEGIGFLKADAIALDNGIELSSPMRLKAALLYVLKTYVYSNGHTYIKQNQWYEEAIRFTNSMQEVLTKEVFVDLKRELITERKIIQDEEQDIYLSKIYTDECRLAKRIQLFLASEVKPFEEHIVEEQIEQVMAHEGITYNPKQYEAIKKALIEPISIITGGPGTGKSTIIKAIIECFAALHPNSEVIRDVIKLVAPTGRAAKRLRELTHHPATTVHKLLGYDGGDIFLVTPDQPIEAKLVIIDEFSMVDNALASLLFSCLLPTTKIVMVGDSDQLPSVGPGNVLYDLITSKEITTIRLDRIHRQAASSSIVTLAHAINHGELPQEITTLQSDRSFINSDNMNIIPLIEKTIRQALDKGMDLVRDIQVLVPLYRGEVGIDAINYQLQDVFNPSVVQVTLFGRRFRVNDKVIQLVNRHEKQVMNGDIGSILTLEFDEDKFLRLVVLFDFGPVTYEGDELEDLQLAYAISIHKAQGSEFPLVIMPFSFKYYVMLKRKLIYTGITRAKQYLIMIGSLEALRKGVVELEDNRMTKLCHRLTQAINEPQLTLKEQDNEDVKPEDFM